MKANREDVVCTLLAARCLISDKNAWTQRANARDRRGRETFNPDEEYQWCAYGALYAVAPNDTVRVRAGDYLSVSAEPITVARLNDELGHAATLAMYDRAIELAAA